MRKLVIFFKQKFCRISDTYVWNFNEMLTNDIISCLTNRALAPSYKTFSVLNSAEHEILNAHEYENIKKFSFL